MDSNTAFALGLITSALQTVFVMLSWIPGALVAGIGWLLVRKGSPVLAAALQGKNAA